MGGEARVSRRRKGGNGARERRRGVGAPAREDAKKERGDGAEDMVHGRGCVRRVAWHALAPVSVMHVTSMIASQPAVGVASSEAKQSVGMSANLRPCDGER